jgi:hypothetical protein
MKLIDAIRNVVILESKSPWDNHASLDEIAADFGIDHFYSAPDELNARIKAYPISSWLCTDTGVGINAIYFDGEPAGSSSKQARKDGLFVEWISQEIAMRVRDAIMEHVRQGSIAIIDPEEEIGDGFTVNFAGQAFTDDGRYQGRPVKALIWYSSIGDHTPERARRAGRSYMVGVPYKDEKADHLLVQDGDEQRLIPFSEFIIPYSVKTPE